MNTITITCPGCSAELQMQTRAMQQCDVHHWHARAGDSTICTECKFEWVVMPAEAAPFTPTNREYHYNETTAIDTCNDVFLAVRTRTK